MMNSPQRLFRAARHLARQLPSGRERWLRLPAAVDFHRSDSEGALCARLVSSFPSSRWEDWRLVPSCCFGGAVTRLLEHLRVQTYESPWMACWLLALTWTVQPKFS
jgi:hypothetical protein